MTLTPDSTKTADVAVIVTSYNHQAFVEQCLDSIAAQTRAPQQVIVIDDRSTDDSANVIERWLADNANDYRYLRHADNLGLCASLNEALALVDSEFYCHVSSDDWEAPDRLERQVAAFEKSGPDVALVVSDIREVDAGGGTIADHDFAPRLGPLDTPSRRSDLLSRLLKENVIPAPGVMIRTAAARAVGGYDENLFFEDYDLWMRLAGKFDVVHAPGVAANYRVVGSGMLRNPQRRVGLLTSEATMLAKHIDSSSANNETIALRLVDIAGDLIELRAVSAVRTVLGYAASASADPWIRAAQRTAERPRGLLRLERTQAERFGIALQ